MRRRQPLDRARARRRPRWASAGPVGVWSTVESPWGPVYFAVTDRGLAAVQLEGTPESFADQVARRLRGIVIPEQGGISPIWERLLAMVRVQLAQFFDGKRESFDVPVDLRGLSDWDRRVLEATRLLGYGRVTSYGRLAQMLGAPRAARAVGNALGRNPVWIVIPCHRVIAGNAHLGGYGGGARMLKLKRALLAREGVTIPARGMLA